MQLHEITLLCRRVKAGCWSSSAARPRQEAEDQARGLMEELKKGDNPPSMKLYDNREKKRTAVGGSRSRVWARLRSCPASTIHGRAWEDSAVPPDKVGDYLRDLKQAVRRARTDNPSVYGHFGQGCIHCRFRLTCRPSDGIGEVSEVHGRSDRFGGVAMAVRFRANTAMARHARDTLPKMFGEELSPGISGVQVDLGSRRENESGEGGGRV